MIREFLAAHSLTSGEIAQAVNTDIEKGLSNTEARNRLTVEGPNALIEGKPVTLWQVIVRQFTSFLIAVLIFAGAISLVIGEIGDAIVILAIVLLNAALGAFQELRAEHALEALRHTIAPTARVIREGVTTEVPTADLVRGDLVILQAGDLAPADLRLTEDHSLSVDESPLTGESMPVEKSAGTWFQENTALGDRANCVYMGTSVAYGRGAGLVFATGMGTQLGQIAGLVSTQHRAETPLQQRLGVLGKQLGIVALALCAAVFFAGWLRGQELLEMFLVAVALAVAAIPEGLPAVVTIALALGLQRMLQRHALIRRLAAVETLGAATVICTDKTGTLTRGQMTVERLYLGGEHYHLEDGALRIGDRSVELRPGSPLHNLLLGLDLCNDATLEQVRDGSLQLTGSPTEVALARAAQQSLGTSTREKFPRIAEVPFDSRRKRMTTAHRTLDGGTIVFMKGAPDMVLTCSTHIASDEGQEPLDATARELLEEVVQELASQAYRVLAVAWRDDPETRPSSSPQGMEQGLTFLGLLGLIDPPRVETPEAIAHCTQAGIRTIMVTGDHADTATAIARAVGILSSKAGEEQSSEVLNGPQLDQMGPEELGQALQSTRVFARVAPGHKLRIVEALQSENQIVAMTGDGANDAPALKRANIGVAMGIRGTEVSKEAADMVLTDDNFQSIVAAVHEGRVIYSNIRKVVMYLLSCNLGEILAIFVATVAGLPLILHPIQILWVNLVTDGLPALALSAEKEEPGVMRRPPRDPKEGILTGRSAILIFNQGLMVGGVTLATFLISLNLYPDEVPRAQTAAFLSLALSQLLMAAAFRAELVSVLRQGLLSNWWMVWATIASSGLLFAVIYLPPAQPWFNTTTPGLGEWAYIGPLSLIPLIVAEATKALTGWRR